MEDEMLTTTQAAALLKLSPSTVTRMADNGELEVAETPGGHRRIPRRVVEEYLQKLQRAAARTVMIVNQKGGVGKTTMTVNWAVLLAQAGARVLVVDLDMQGHAGLSLGFVPDALERTLYNALLAPQATPLSTVILHSKYGVDLVPMNIAADNIDADMHNHPAWGTALRDLLDQVRGQYDYILIDGEPHTGKPNVMGFMAAQWLVIPSQPQLLSIHGLKLLLARIDQARVTGNPDLQVAGVVLTMVQNIASDQEMVDALRTQLPGSHRKLRVFEDVIPQRAAIKNAANNRDILAAKEPHTEPTEHFRRTLVELLRIVGGAVAPEAVAPRERVAVAG